VTSRSVTGRHIRSFSLDFYRDCFTQSLCEFHIYI
jgi:hypothetical protein